MDQYRFFSGDKPTVEDEHFSRDAMIAAILDRTHDLFTDGIVAGLDLAHDGDDLVVAQGLAYCAGERLVLEDEHREAWPGTDSWVFIGFTHVDEAPKVHYISGESFATRRMLHVHVRLSSSSSIPDDGEILLGRALSAGGAQDLRTFAQVVSDPRIHQPNTDTHTTAAEFRVGYEDAANTGSPVLTVAAAISQHAELELLFRHGIINLQDGHGDRMVEARKIPSAPNVPVLAAENARLKIHGLAPERDAELRSALDAHEAAKVSVNTLATQITELESYRALVNAKRVMGYNLDQIRGAANVGAAPDLDVLTAKQQAMVSGAAGVSREPGTLQILEGFTHAVGTGTSLTSTLVGKKLLLHAGGLLKEYTVASVNVGAQTLEWTANAAETENAAHFYLADAELMGFGSAIATVSEMLGKIDTLRTTKAGIKSDMTARQAAAGDAVLKAYTTREAMADESYSLQLTWDRPALVDLEEIRAYRVRVYELKHNRTQIPQGISKGSLESSHQDLIHRTVDWGTTQRQKREEPRANELTTTGSSTSLIKVAGASIFQPGTRVKVGSQSGVVKSYDPVTRTVELLQPLPSAPAAGVTVVSFELVWDSDVITEQIEFPIRGGQHLVIFAQSVSEFDVGSDWSTGLVLLTDNLEDADGATLAERILRLRNLEQGRFGIERDRMAAEVQDQLVVVQQALASMPSQDQIDTIVATLETIQASL